MVQDYLHACKKLQTSKKIDPFSAEELILSYLDLFLELLRVLYFPMQRRRLKKNTSTYFLPKKINLNVVSICLFMFLFGLGTGSRTAKEDKGQI